MMKGNKFNDLWVIINNVSASLYDRLPGSFLEFVKSSMVPDGESAVSSEMPLEEQDIPDSTRNLLASLYLTYWAEDKWKRRQFAEQLYSNELADTKEEPRPMTEDEYQAFLKDFDDWNELFGPIPFWPESRGWQPEKCYEIVSEGDAAELTAGDIGLKEVYVDLQQRESILHEARAWVLAMQIEEEEVLYWHNDDRDSWSSTKEIEDYYKQAVVIKDGHFFGALIHSDHNWGMGMASYRNDAFGILFVDGSKAGRTDDYESRSSDESSYEKTTTYSLKRK